MGGPSRGAALPSPLYCILDPEVSRGRDLPSLLDAVLAGGCRVVQLRDKRSPMPALLDVARALARRCRETGALFIVNDRVDLALAADAGGVHVGQDDLPASAIRSLLRPGMILGVSTHDPAQARRALADGADYVAVGSMFPTGTKPAFQLVGPALVRELRPEIPVPLVGIGGIGADNAGEVIAAGADAVAVISAVCSAPDPESATRRLMTAIQAAIARRDRPGNHGSLR
jgi:thiamine-phosphate pyrophosphorylase